VARLRMLMRQVPLMYAIVCINMIALVITQRDAATGWTALVAPGVFLVIAVLRTLSLWRLRHVAVTPEEARRQVQGVLFVSMLLGPAFSFWALSLHGIGNAEVKGQIAFFVGLTVIAVMTCLMPVRQVAVVMFATVVVPMALFLGTQPDVISQAIALNMLIVTGTMVVVTYRAYADFKASFDKSFELDQNRQVLQALNADVSRLANEDSLTGLPNRRSFFSGLKALIAERGSGGAPFAVGLLDLDGFKPINDVFGHAAGDELLKVAAQRMTAALPPGSLLARVGGDEFAMILDPAPSEAELLDAGLGVVNALRPAFALSEGTASVTATLGLARYPDAGGSAEALFEHADYTLYFTKQRQRGEVSIYSREHEMVIREVAAVAQRLREADLEDELSVAFQPIIDSRTGRVKGFEALARWTSPVLGAVSPDLFIRTAEQAGIISRLTLVLLQKALDAAALWPAQSYLSFNLSSYDLCSEQAVARIIETVYQSPVPMKQMVFEITESAVMQDFDRAIAGLERLRKAGAAIALDDFGTGFSALSYVRSLPIDRVKIDRSFVSDLADDKAARDIVKAIIDLCANLGLDCIVEGVETEAQLKVLQAMGCTTIQGYYFARPMDAAAVARYAAVDQRLQAAG